ncbi:hypothetical protein M378DRAFT_9368 [Amanita muscaria Koide BX008]|uniref:Uncharacterized protein n=1 Tax=Amanita muscaria (strain Koide BX008) TaxID=946122 RepID=A0A0C2XFG2_AMAMK|nr:hypothetical protein M378DRAFT_9368 [Amanita muscaria Koide BX008]
MTSSSRNRSRPNPQPPQHLRSHSESLSAHPFPIAPSGPFHGSSYSHWDVPASLRPRVHSAVDYQQPSINTSTSSSGMLSFPEPQLYRSVSESKVNPHNISRQHSNYDLVGAADLHRGPSVSSTHSTTSSYYRHDDDYEELYLGDHSFESLVDDGVRVSLDAEEAVKLFQRGELPESGQEWHKMVPKEAIEAFGKQEVQRQSVIFELFKAERDYVADLRAVQDLFINGLRNATQPIIMLSNLQDFIDKVFANLSAILEHHDRMLAALFQRQRDQHPLVQSVSDIIFDTVLRTEFRSDYEAYIKHYPIAESFHRKELASNPAYKRFLESVADNPRIRKRDLITFLSRPVTRLPRLSLVLEQTLKLTEKDFNQSDLESLPIILSILSDFLKSTQPGIEAADSKAKLWELTEHLEYQQGEIIDMDLSDESRTLVYSGPVARRIRGDTGFSTWIDLTATLLDNYFILTRDVKRPNDVVKKQLMSRPIPLSHLLYASFDGAPETRREKSEERGILESLRSQTVEIFPFTVFHASNSIQRRYTLFASSEASRRRWKTVLDDATGLYKARQEANMWYDPQTLTDGHFRFPSQRSFTNNFTGRALTAAPFTSGGRKYIAVGCPTGIYASTWGSEDFRRVLNLQNPVQLAAVHELGDKQFHRLIVQHEHTILSYSLDVLARVATGQAQPSSLDATMERVAGSDSNVIFFRAAEMGQRLLVMYASKRLLQVNPSLHVLEAVDASGAVGKRSGMPASFRPFGESGYVPRDPTDIIPLTKNVGVITHDGIVIVDPINFAKSVISVVPDLHSSNDHAVSLLKDRIDDAKALGLIRVTADELMVVYDIIGCYMTKYGMPTRSAGYVKWETRAQSYAHRGNHVLLFSHQFIEVRDIRNGRIMQVIEGQEIRRLYFNASIGNKDPIIVAMKGKTDNKDGASDRLVELKETVELNPSSPLTRHTSAKASTSIAAPYLWDEWDM